jgi:CDP-diacylglycerol--glycerol-3-phosphate 3-phosphatidyltransferase
MPNLNILPQRLATSIAEPIGRSVGAIGITPNMVSIAGFAGNLVAGWLIMQEALFWAGIVFLFFSALDLVDGAVARATGKASDYGAVLDAVLDRAAEVVILAACAWYFAGRGETVQCAVTYCALLGSVAVSYMRASAEVAGLSMREGIFRRQERVALLVIGLVFNGLTVVIWILAILANLTALQRFVLIAKGLRAEEAPN